MSEFIEAYKKICAICEKYNFGDAFAYSRGREIYMAEILGHTICDTYSGADAYDENGEYEYKSTTTDNISGTYNGISVQPTLEKQIDYIKNDKIGKYSKHYVARFSGPNIVELYEIDAKDVLKVLLPKIEAEWVKKRQKTIGLKIHELV